jgi:hypothetical protein
LIALERAPATNAAPATVAATPGGNQPAGERRGGRRGFGGFFNGPALLDIMAVGRE